MGVSPDTGEAIRARVRSLEELKELNRRKKEVKNIGGLAGADSSLPRLTMTTW